MKRKQVLSLVVTSAMLLSRMGTEAMAEPIRQDAQPAITVDSGTEPMPGMATEENEDEAKNRISEGTEAESGDGTKKENKEEPGEETEEESKDGAEEKPEEKPGEESEEESKDGAEEKPEEKPGEESEEESKDGAEEKPEEKPGEESEEESKDGAEEKPEEKPGEESEEESRDGAEEKPEEKPGEESEEGSKDEAEEKPREENGEESEEESEADDLLKDLENTSSAGPENPEAKPPVDSIPIIDEHRWSADWNYDGTHHWHECTDEDCPEVEDSEKDGYAEHIYDDHGVCTICGYDAMDGIAVTAEGAVPSYQEAYEAMIALEDKYPEGMTWTNFEPYGSKGELGSAYTWKGGPIYGAKSSVGCMAFAFILSDAAFGNLPARAIKKGDFTFEEVKVGDILRVNNNSHSVIVLKKNSGGVIVAEGNYHKSVHWGRSMSAAAVKNADFIVTRYPKGYVSPDDSGVDEVVSEGMEGNLAWSLTNGGVLTISGNGAMPDYSQNNLPPWRDHEVSIIVLEDGITSIGDYAFYQSNAFRVTIPDSVKDIGNSAFQGCENLTSATVSEGVETIGDEAFRGCTALTHIDFPASIISVGTAAFMSCTEMVSVRFQPGSSNVELGDNLFSQCRHLTHVTLPQTANRISAGMFQSCISLPSLYIPASVRMIGANPFTSCNFLKTIYFGGSEAQWNSITNPYLQASLQSTGTKVEYNAEFNDPFATDPDDPGDFQPVEDDSCTNHIDADHDGKCDNCGKDMPSDNPGSDSGNGDHENPGNPGGNQPPATDNPSGGSSGGSSSGSSGGSSSGPSGGNSGNPGNSGGNSSSSGSHRPSASNSSSGSSSGSPGVRSSAGSPDSSDSHTISTTVGQRADGARVTTKTQGDGTVITIAEPAAGAAEVEARLSDLAIETARKGNKAVALPISAVPTGKDASAAPTITVYTQRNTLVKVAIPTAAPTAGTVAVIVNEDGSTSVIRGSVLAGNHVVVALPDGATIKIVDNAKNFSDVPAAVWYEEAVSFVSSRELFYHTSETVFAPAAPMTYGVLTTALARFDGTETDGGTAWYEKGMEWAASRGIGYEAGPDSNITCDQLAFILWKYQGSPSEDGSPDDNADSGQIDDTQKAMDWIVKQGIVSGFEEGAWAPQKPVNRSQAAQIIMNFAKKTAVGSVR